MRVNSVGQMSILLVGVATATVLTGCSAGSAPGATEATTSASATSQASAGTTAADLLAAYDLTGKSPEQVVETLDQDPAPRPRPLRASVRSGEVLLDDGARQATLPLTNNRFYLSIAPYERRTHDCYNHNLGTCQGELAAAKVHVKIVDDAGRPLVDRPVTTYANGFVGFWLPKGIKGTVTVTKDGGKTGQVPFATTESSPTCLTTLRLA